MTLPFELTGPIVVPIALGALALNVFCLAVLLVLGSVYR